MRDYLNPPCPSKRMPIFADNVVATSQPLAAIAGLSIIKAGGNALEIAEQAKKEGTNDLRRSGLNKVRDGLTSLEEINRITKD